MRTSKLTSVGLFPFVVLTTIAVSIAIQWIPKSENEVEIFGLGVPLLTTCFLPLAFGDIVREVFTRRSNRLAAVAVRPIMASWLAYLLAAGISTIIAGATGVGIGYMLGAVFFVTWFGLAATSTTANYFSPFVLRVWAAMTFVLCVSGIATGRGLRAVPDNINLVAMLAVFGAGLTLVACFSRQLPTWMLINVPLVFLILLMDRRRTAVGSMILVVLLASIWSRRDSGRQRHQRRASRLGKPRRAALATMIFILLGIALLFEQSRVGISNGFDYVASSLGFFGASSRIATDERRASLISEALVTISRTFPIGVGYGHYVEYVKYSLRGADAVKPHNFVLFSTAELGLAGLVISSAAVLAPFRTAWRSSARWISMSLSAVPFLFVFTNDYMFSPMYWIPVMFGANIAWRGTAALARRNSALPRNPGKVDHLARSGQPLIESRESNSAVVES